MLAKVFVQCGDLKILPARASWADEPKHKRFIRAWGETNDENVSSSRRASKRIAVGLGINRGGRCDGLDALCHRVAIEHHWKPTRRHPMDVVREVWRLVPRIVSRLVGPGLGIPVRSRAIVQFYRGVSGAVHLISAGSNWSRRPSALPFFCASRWADHERKCRSKPLYNQEEFRTRTGRGAWRLPPPDTLLLLWRRRKDVASSTHRVRGVI